MSDSISTASSNPKLYASTCAALSIAIGFAGLSGWLFNNYFLKSFLSDGATMKVNTALLVLSSGLSLLLLVNESTKISRGLSIFVMLLSLVILTEYVAGINLHIDELFIKDTATNPLLETPGRTSLLTSLIALLTGTSLLVISYRHFRFGQLLACTVFSVVYISLIGHLFHITGFYQFGKYSGVAFHTGLGLVLTAVGILAANRRQGWVGFLYSRLANYQLRLYFFGYTLGATPLMAAIYLFVIRESSLSPASDVVLLILVTIVLSMPVAYFLLKTVGILGKELTESDAKLGIALTAAHLGVLHIDPETKALSYNTILAEIFGYQDSIPMTYEQAIAQVTPAYRSKILLEIERAIQAGGDYDITYQQLRFNDGQPIWLRSFGKVTADENGKYTIFSGVVMDITDRVREQEQLLQLNEDLASTIEELRAANEELSDSGDIQRRLLEDLAANEYKTRTIIESAPFPIGVYTGKKMQIGFANKAIIEAWGKGPDVIGRFYADLLPELENQKVFEQLDTVFNSGIPFETRNQRLEFVNDGLSKIVYYNYNFTPLANEAGEIYGVMSTAAEVTDLVLAKQQFEEASASLAILNEELGAVNEELTAANEEQADVNQQLAYLNDRYKQSQNELELAIEAAALGTFDLNPATGRFAGNDQLKSWFGLAPEDEIELTKAINVIAEADRERVLQAIEKAMEFGSVSEYDIEYTIINPRDMVPIIVRAKGKALFNGEKQAIRFSGIVQDITEQKKDEQRKNDFIGMVSHELKTPLTSLTAIIQVLNSKFKNSGDQFIPGALDKANVQVKKMGTMINGFLNVSRLESGKIQIDKTRFNIDQLTREVIEDIKLTVTDHNIELVPCDPVEVFADRDKVASVISNLASNAVKYSPKHSSIQIICMAMNDHVQISVADEGLGISPADQVKIFERYYRVKTEHGFTASGFGIGLYLSAEIVMRHAGKIWVKSELGHGSTFYFTLPM
jgi:PAS domain S-box-containing protein